MMTGLMKRFLN